MITAIYSEVDLVPIRTLCETFSVPEYRICVWWLRKRYRLRTRTRIIAPRRDHDHHHSESPSGKIVVFRIGCLPALLFVGGVP